MFDLCGHEKYFKTTAYGVSGCFPDYSFVIIGANRGISNDD
jgi:GTPase